jgi:hypothetical protein
MCHGSGEKMCKPWVAHSIRAVVRISEGPGLESRSGCTFFLPCDIWRPIWGCDWIKLRVKFTSFYNLRKLRMNYMNYNIAGKYLTLKNFTIKGRKCIRDRIAHSVEPRYGIPSVLGSSPDQVAAQYSFLFCCFLYINFIFCRYFIVLSLCRYFITATKQNNRKK